MDLLDLRIEQVGITVLPTVDWDSVGKTLENALVPLIPAFIPTAINIALFGKRSVESNLQVAYQII